MADKCPACGGTDVIFGQSPRNLVVHNDYTYHTKCLIEMLGGGPPKYVRVYKDSAVSYLCRWVNDHYEIEASGNSSSIQKLVDKLNGS